MLGLTLGKSEDTFFTTLHKFGDTISFDIALILHAQLFLNLNLDPQALGVEAILIALLVALHGLKTLKQIFVRASPGMMNAHRVVRGDGAIQERELFVAALIAAQVHLQHTLLVPPLLDGMLQRWIINTIGCCNWSEYTGFYWHICLLDLIR